MNIAQNQNCNGILSQLADICSGKRPISTEIGEIPLVGAGGVMGYISQYNFNEPILVTGRVGTHGIIQRFLNKCWASDNTLVIKTEYYEYVYQFLRKVDFDRLNRGSTQPLITQTDLNNLSIYIPEPKVLYNFLEKSNNIMAFYSLQSKEIEELEKLKITLINSLATN